MSATLAEVLAETFYTGHGWSWADDELDPADRRACVEEFRPVAATVLAWLEGLCEQHQAEYYTLALRVTCVEVATLLAAAREGVRDA